MKVVLLLLLPILTLAQNPVAGKTFSTETSQSCNKTTSGGYTVYSYTTMVFSKDSVTCTHYSKRTDEELPNITKNGYTYKMSIAGESILLSTPNNDRYIIRDGMLISDCTYNRGKEYFEITSD
jgi:hypothetical protein